MGAIAYIHGEFRDLADARVSLLDRGYLLGDSIFETLRTYGGVPFRLAEHLARLKRASDVTGIGEEVGEKGDGTLLPERSRGGFAQKSPTPIFSNLAPLVLETLRRSGLQEAYLRITISRGEGPGGISPSGCDEPVLSIIARPWKPFPAEAYQQGIRSATVTPRRIPAACLDPTFKSGNYLPHVLARRELDALGMLEGVQRAVDGQVVGGTVSNVFCVHGDRLITPWPESGCLPGITRAAVLELAPRVGLVPVERRVEPDDLLAADELFFTNTLMECLPVAELDGRRFAGAAGPYTRAIHEAFGALVRRETAACS